jgi:hypothetical protein
MSTKGGLALVSGSPMLSNNGGRTAVANYGWIWYLVTVVDLVEGHIRIHFVNTKKHGDEWSPLNSERLAMDGGEVSKQEEENEAAVYVCKKERELE